MKIFLTVVLSALIFAACEKSVSFKLKDTSPRLVVEGIIETGEPPRVVLTSSLNYFTRISTDILLNSFVHNAEIVVSNGSRTHTLKEYEIEVFDGQKLFYYSIDSADLASSFDGEPGTTYDMIIKADGREYTATTTIPLPAKTLDSLWWQQSPNNPDTSKVVLMAKLTDPKGFGNYIRYFTSVNGSVFYPGLNSVFDDQIIDGTSYAVEVEQGINRNEEIDLEEYSYFTRGDSVAVKFCNIDKACFDFWRTMEYSYASIGNPFSSPTRVLGNISGGALGYFGGYAVQYRSIKIPG